MVESSCVWWRGEARSTGAAGLGGVGGLGVGKELERGVQRTQKDEPSLARKVFLFRSEEQGLLDSSTGPRRGMKRTGTRIAARELVATRESCGGGGSSVRTDLRVRER